MSDFFTVDTIFLKRLYVRFSPDDRQDATADPCPATACLWLARRTLCRRQPPGAGRAALELVAGDEGELIATRELYPIC